MTEQSDGGLRLLSRIGMAGLALAAVVAVVIGIAADSGRSALAMFLLVAALTSAVVGLAGTVTLFRSEHRDEAIPRARIVVTVGAFLGTTLLLAMVVGVAGGS